MKYTESSAFPQKEDSDLQISTIFNRVQFKIALNIIHALGSNKGPKQLLNAFDLSVLNLRENTGEITLTRYQLAQEIGCSLNNARCIMNTLVRLGIITSERKTTKGKRGSGITTYFINPNVAWKGSFFAFKAKMAESKPLLLPSP